MTLYQIDVEKRFQTEYWTNVYHVNADTLSAASALADQIVAIEQSVHFSDVVFTKARTSTAAPNDTVYTTNTYNLAGLVGSTDDRLPLFNVIRVDFNVYGSRPCRKYLRCPVNEGIMGPAGSVSSGWISSMLANYVNPLVTLGIVSPNGSAITSGNVSPLVGMRQLRRGSKRRAQPIL